MFSPDAKMSDDLPNYTPPSILKPPKFDIGRLNLHEVIYRTAQVSDSGDSLVINVVGKSFELKFSSSYSIVSIE
jgi:hypothetical protein